MYMYAITINEKGGQGFLKRVKRGIGKGLKGGKGRGE